MFQSTLDAALRYADRGWPVFPCRPDKKPFTEHGFLDATTDHAQIVAWWRQHPDAQIGVSCGAAGICVVDLDMGNGKDGISFFARLEAEHGPHWCGLIASTPRGGRHYVYLMPDPSVSIASDIVEKQSGIDVRADGGYIVVPSPASPGREWVVGDPFEIDTATGECDLVAMPKWVEKIVRGGRKVHAPSPAGESGRAMVLPDDQVDAIRRALQHIDSNPRDVWIRVGMALKSTGARDQAYELWCEWSATSPKFNAKDQAYQWNSLREFFLDGHEVTIATLFHMAKEGGYVLSIADEVAAEVVPATPIERTVPIQAVKRPFPRELMNVPGLVGDVADWLVQSSTRQQPALCLASAIATMGAVLGRRVATQTDLRTNVYLLGIGETACGKDPGVSLPHLLLTRAQLGSVVGPGEWKSDSGLRAALVETPSHVALCDEFTKTLDALSGKQVPPHMKGIKKYLLQMWAASNSVHLSPGYGDRKLNKPVVIEQPNLCLYGTGVPEELFSCLDRGAVRDGFLNRFLIFFADEQFPQRRKVCRAEPPQELVDRLAALSKATETGNLATLSNATPKARVVPRTDDAEALLGSLEDENDRRVMDLRRQREPLSDLWVRFGSHVAKLALIRSASDDPNRATDVLDVCWARDLVLWCLERTMAEAESRVADSQQEAATKRVLRAIVEAGPDGLTASELTRRTQWLRRSDRKDIIATLLESGQVSSSLRETSTRPVTIFVACNPADDTWLQPSG